MNRASPTNLTFFVTPPHACSYLPDRDASSVFADPGFVIGTGLYSRLSAHGFRRSGEHVYRPACDGCRACVPVRVPAAEFRPRRSQRRALAANTDVEVVARPPAYDDDHFALYRRYVDSRHPAGGMDNPEADQYLQFLTSSWSDTVFYEFRRRGELLGVAVTDRLDDGLSAVYTFYEPGAPRRSLGIYSILWQIQETRRLGLSWLYLGYLIRECRKMRYKEEFRPQEHLRDGGWVRDPE